MYLAPRYRSLLDCSHPQLLLPLHSPSYRAEARKQPRPLKDTQGVRPPGNSLGSSGGLLNRVNSQLVGIPRRLLGLSPIGWVVSACPFLRAFMIVLTEPSAQVARGNGEPEGSCSSSQQDCVVQAFFLQYNPTVYCGLAVVPLASIVFIPIFTCSSV